MKLNFENILVPLLKKKKKVGFPLSITYDHYLKIVFAA